MTEKISLEDQWDIAQMTEDFECRALEFLGRISVENKKLKAEIEDIKNWRRYKEEKIGKLEGTILSKAVEIKELKEVILALGNKIKELEDVH